MQIPLRAARIRRCAGDLPPPAASVAPSKPPRVKRPAALDLLAAEAWRPASRINNYFGQPVQKKSRGAGSASPRIGACCPTPISVVTH